MRIINRYAVVATECDVSDFAAIFDDETQADEYAAKISGDPDFDRCDYAVVLIRLDADTIEEEEV